MTKFSSLTQAPVADNRNSFFGAVNATPENRRISFSNLESVFDISQATHLAPAQGLDLSTQVTGVLPPANGGTGQNTVQNGSNYIFNTNVLSPPPADYARVYRYDNSGTLRQAPNPYIACMNLFSGGDNYRTNDYVSYSSSLSQFDRVPKGVLNTGVYPGATGFSDIASKIVDYYFWERYLNILESPNPRFRFYMPITYVANTGWAASCELWLGDDANRFQYQFYPLAGQNPTPGLSGNGYANEETTGVYTVASTSTVTPAAGVYTKTGNRPLITLLVSANNTDTAQIRRVDLYLQAYYAI
jgi:hypothetical protein